MALTAGTVCEIRTTGSQNAGGGFYDRNPGTSSVTAIFLMLKKRR